MRMYIYTYIHIYIISILVWYKNLRYVFIGTNKTGCDSNAEMRAHAEH